MARDATRCAGEVPIQADPEADLESTDPFEALRAWWPGPCPDGCRCLEPFEGSFPTTPARLGGIDWSRPRSTVASACEFARGTVYTPRTYGAKIRNAGHWRFWWD